LARTSASTRLERSIAEVSISKGSKSVLLEMQKTTSRSWPPEAFHPTTDEDYEAGMVSQYPETTLYREI
jgi:hypothetical protein